MLEPQSRATLTDLLHPPPGFELAHAVATTFTLDLDTALTIPLCFASRRIASGDDQVGLIDAVTRVTDKIDIFAQAGQVGIEIPPSALVSFLEPMVHPVHAARGIFHPKVWFLEYARGDERAYRFVCASRNLTADRSWDVVISLDGVPAEASDLIAARKMNEPLQRLLRSLPEMAVRPLPRARRARVAALASRIGNVVWTPPPGTRDVRFHVWGVGSEPEPNFSGTRALLISPFLTDEGLKHLKKSADRGAVLISRATSIDALGQATIARRVRKVFVLDDAVGAVADDGGKPGARPSLTGLHAKAYLFDRGYETHVFLGSLNATYAALHGNVEIMVEVVGKKGNFGVEKTLAGFGDLIQEYEYSGGAEDATDEEADRALASVLRRIAELCFDARVVHDESYGLRVWCGERATLPSDVDLTWSIITRAEARFVGLPGDVDSPSEIDGLDLTEITPFLLVTVRDGRGDRSAQRTIVVAELHDDPANRRDAVIAAHLVDRAAFVRFLVLMLELGGVALPSAGGGGSWAVASESGEEPALFEALMRAVGKGRTGLRDVQRITDYMRRQDTTGTVLPDGFDVLWDSIWAAQQIVDGEARG